MKKLSVKQKNWLVSLHVVISAIWLGAACSALAIALYAMQRNNGDELYALRAVAKLIDDFAIIPSANVSLITGALLCWLTIWGFFKHYWVITKWIMTVTLISFGTIWLGPWVNAMTSISEVERSQALQNPLYVFDSRAMLIGGSIQIVSLVFIIFVSVLKPWGKRLIKSVSEK